VDAPPGATGTPDPTAEDCRQALDAARAVIARLPATHPERFALERTVSDASNEGGSGEYDECVELAERARERAETLLAQDPSPT
jgi:hypothetical protein